MSSILWLIWLLLSCNQLLNTDAYSNAKRKWQLGENAGAYEPIRERDAEYPKLTDTILVGMGYLPYRAFKFNGTNDYVEVIVDNSDKYKTFSILVIIYPEIVSGTIFHYKYNEGGQDGIDSVHLRADNGDLRVEVKHDATTWTLTAAGTIISNQWLRIVFQRDMDGSKILLFVNGAAYQASGPLKESTYTEYLGTPGTLCLGKNLDTDSSYFLGKMTCVLMFTNLYDDNERAEAEKECIDMVANGGKRLPGLVDLEAPPVPRSFWGLDDLSFGSRFTGEPPLYPEYSQCLRLASRCRDLPQAKSVYIDGSETGHIDLKFPLDVLQGDFQIAFYIKPALPLTGTLFHFKYDGTETGIREIILSTTDGGASLSVCDHVQCCGSLSAPGLIKSDKWHFIVVERSGSAISLDVNGSPVGTPNSCVTGSQDTSSEGVLRLGNTMDGNDVLRGQVTCLAVYGDVISITSRKFYHIEYYEILPRVGVTSDTSVCHSETDYRYSRSSLHKRDVGPNVNESPMFISTHCGLPRCSAYCLNTRYCRSFTFEGSNEPCVCKVYDFVTRLTGLKADEGVDYYTLHRDVNNTLAP